MCSMRRGRVEVMPALLDERGFVFMDEAGRPYLCRMWNGTPWLFYWHADLHWVSLRQCTQMDVWRFPNNMAEAEQERYREAHRQWEESMAR